MDTIEIIVAKWSAPAIAAKQTLDQWIDESGWNGKLVVHDADEFSDPPHTHGWGECRINGGPWMRVPELLAKLE